MMETMAKPRSASITSSREELSVIGFTWQNEQNV
jgi:hypothetical protein